MTQVLFDPLFLQLLVHKYRLHTIHYEAIEQYMYNAGNLCLQFISPMKSSPTEAGRTEGQQTKVLENLSKMMHLNAWLVVSCRHLVKESCKISSDHQRLGAIEKLLLVGHYNF